MASRGRISMQWAFGRLAVATRSLAARKVPGSDFSGLGVQGVELWFKVYGV